MMYFECRNKQFEERKNQGGKIIIKNKSQFYFPGRVSAVIVGFVKQVLKNNGLITFFNFTKPQLVDISIYSYTQLILISLCH